MVSVPTKLAVHIDGWAGLHRWERAELGRALRRLGLSYGEITALIPVPKGTLAGWCRDIVLSPQQAAAIAARTGSRRGVPRDTQRKRRAEGERIRAEARAFAAEHLTDPFWVAGTVLYWGEGSKSKRMLSLSNSDPRALRLFMDWTRTYLRPDPRFVLSIHLHAGNDEAAARNYWAASLDLADPDFYKTFLKPDGTGHRKNHLPHGTCRVLLRRSTDPFVAVMAWIDVVATKLPGARC